MMTTPTAVELLGLELHSSKGAVATESLFQKESVLGLYFGSGWCPPCKAFTSKLSSFYSNLKEKGKHHLEIVFVSSDYSQEEFVETFATMPWLAVPFDKDKKLRLTRRYRINSLPSLVLIDPHTLRVLCRSGREMVLSDPEGLRFPWQPRSVVDVLSTTTLIDQNEQVVGYDSLKESYKALYFSAHWCPPCKAFTPVLVSTFNKVRERGEKLEVIFVSSDRSEESWQKYRSTMPWLSVTWSEEESRRELASALQVDGIPTLVLLQPDGSVLTSDGRERINEDPEGEMFPWNPQSVDTLGERHMTRLQDNPILVLFTDGEATELQFARDVLLPVAEDYLAAKCEGDGTALRFFVAGEDEISDSLREYAQLEDVVPLVAIVDLAEGTKYVLEEGVEVSTATVYNFVSRYNKGKLTPIAIRSEPDEESMQTS